MNNIHQNPINSGSNTIENTSGGNTATATNKPEWIRLPQPGSKCQFTGLSRSTLNELAVSSVANDYNPKVASTLLRKRGAMRGIRLINYDSLMAFLNSPNEEGVIVS